MRTMHASDQQIQQYVFDLDNCEEAIIKHIKSCKKCTNLSRSYLAMSQVLMEQVVPTLDFDLAQLVYNEMNSRKQKPLRDHNTMGALGILCFGVMAILIHVTVNSNIHLIENYLIPIITCFGLFITILWSLDMIKAFNKKMKIMDYL